MAMEFVHRGDPSAWDVAIGDLTTDGTWRDLDLSSIVPEGATAIELHITAKDDSTTSLFRVRQKGLSNDYAARWVYTQVVNLGNEGDFLVACDGDRFIQYWATNTTWTSININVYGWWLNTGEHIIVHRGDPATWDFEKEDLTIDDAFHDLDLSDIVPAGAVAVYLLLHVTVSVGTDGLTYWRKKGNTNEYAVRNARTKNQGGSRGRSFLVACDSNRVIQYKALTNMTWDKIDVSVCSWIIAGEDIDTFVALTDTPVNYTGEAGNAVIVNAGEDGLEFGAAAHTIASHSDTTATGAELEILTDGSETNLHSHAGGGGGGGGGGTTVLQAWAYDSIVQGTWAQSINTDSLYNFYQLNSTGDDGDEIHYSTYLAAGTYTLKIIGGLGTNQGIIDIYIDAVEVASFDTYAALDRINILTETGIVVASSGVKDIKLIIDGKNGSSSNYYITYQAMTFYRTA